MSDINEEALRSNLYNGDPVPVEDALSHELLDFVAQGRVHIRGLGRNLGYQCITLPLLSTLLKEDLCCLRHDYSD